MKVHRKTGVNGYKSEPQSRCRIESEASCPVKLGGTAEEFQPFGPFDHFDDEEIAWLF